MHPLSYILHSLSLPRTTNPNFAIPPIPLFAAPRRYRWPSYLKRKKDGGWPMSTTVAVAVAVAVAVPVPVPDAELEARLKRVVAENAVDYIHNYLIWVVVYMIVLLLVSRYEFIPQGIIDAGVLVGLLGFCVVSITALLNLKLLKHISERDRFVKYIFGWKMASAFLLLQPRAYGLMKQFLKVVDEVAEADLEKGKEEDEGSSLV